MRRTVLPFTTNVEAKTYQYSAHALGAITASINDAHLWASGKFLSVYFESNDQLHMNDADLWSISEGVTTQTFMNVRATALNSYRTELLGLIKDKISTGNYIVGMCDEYYIPQKKAFQRYHFFHDYLVYGYDDSLRVFKSAGYLSHAKYDYYDIPYDAYLDSITLHNRSEIPLYFRYVDDQYTPKFPLLEVCNKLEEFLLSHANLPYQAGEHNRAYGISGLRRFHEYIINGRYEKLDLRNSRSYMEYFHYMHFRLQTLASAGYLSNHTMINEYYDFMVKPAVMVHNMCIKHSLCGDHRLLLRAGEVIEKLNNQEVGNVERLLRCLK